MKSSTKLGFLFLAFAKAEVTSETKVTTVEATYSMCFNFKADKARLTDDEGAYLDELASDIQEAWTNSISESSLAPEYFSNEYSIGSHSPTTDNLDLENIIIDKINDDGFRFIFRDIVTEVLTTFCGDAKITFEETANEGKTEAKWKEAIILAIGSEGISGMKIEIQTDTEPEPEPVEVNCIIENGGCSHHCFINECRCPSCWTLGLDGRTCEPENDKIKLSCAADHMTITVDECLYNDDIMTLGLNDETCIAEKDGSMYKINTDLDECGNTVQTVGDELIFSNKLTVLNRVSSNGLVFASDFNLPFHCSFPTIVEDLTSSTSVHNAEQVAEGLDGQGQFEFNLKYFTDSSFTDFSTDQDIKVVGESIFFKVEPSHSLLKGLLFMPTTCTVTSGEYSFAILDDQCPSSLVSGNNFGSQLITDSYKFAYRAFTFNTEDTSMIMNTSCTIKVCLENDDSCAEKSC